jgi:sulfoxide reductase catalytic subunit YedY
VSGKVEKPFEVGFDDLMAKMPVEERVYRHRCVETWSMIVPWSGFPLRALVDYCKPVNNPQYIVMKTAMDTKTMPGLEEVVYPWPYIEGLAMDEAMNDLSFVATGLYGKPIPKQNGAPLRLVTPWKYGFKSVKSIVSIEFTDKRPVSFWEKLQASEYGFWANVNPKVPHPRWSQATEKPLGSSERIPTQLYNGYAEWVAGLYENRKSEKLYM